MTHTILLVEDEEDLREMMQEALEMSGFAVVAAKDGREALELLPGISSLCVVVLDLLMPRMNGWDFFDAFRARQEFKAVPVVIHSSAVERAPEGASRILQKPLELQALVAVMREYCAVQ